MARVELEAHVVVFDGLGLLELDGELLHGGVQRLLVAREVGRYGVVEEQELLVHDFDLQCIYLISDNYRVVRYVVDLSFRY